MLRLQTLQDVRFMRTKSAAKGLWGKRCVCERKAACLCDGKAACLCDGAQYHHPCPNDMQARNTRAQKTCRHTAFWRRRAGAGRSRSVERVHDGETRACRVTHATHAAVRNPPVNPSPRPDARWPEPDRSRCCPRKCKQSQARRAAAAARAGAAAHRCRQS